MAIALRTGSAVAWTTGTTIVSASMSLTAGDIVICAASFNPSSLNCTFSKTAGTGAVGTFTHRTKLTNGSQGLTVGYCSVTTTGTVTITATASSTVTNGVLAIEAYSGGSGILGGTGGTGSSGTTASLTKSVTYSNSWVYEAVSLIGNNPSVPTNNTVTVERSVASNISGTTNDLAIGIGSNEAALSPGNFTATMSKGNNVTYSADIVEIVQQFTVSASAGSSGNEAPAVTTNLTSRTVTEAASATKIASSVKAGLGTVSASTAQVANANKSISEAETATAAVVVTTNNTLASESESASATAGVTANLVGRTAALAGSAVSRVAANLVNLLLQEASLATVAVTSNKTTRVATSSASAFAEVGPPHGGRLPWQWYKLKRLT